MKQFFVVIFSSGECNECAISPDLFRSVSDSFLMLSEVILLEERFDAVASSFLEFEKIMLSRGLDFWHAGFKDNLHQMSVRRDLNRVLMSALSAAKGYIDHLPQACGNVFGKDDQRKIACIDSLRNSYKNFLGYRIFEALRNHSQHSGFPIQSISYACQGEGGLPCARFRLTISPMVEIETIARNDKFKKTVLAEMREIGGRVDLKSHFREYMSCIAEAHYIFREFSSPIVDVANTTYDQLMQLFPMLGDGGEGVLFRLVAKDGDRIVEEVQLSGEIYAYCEYLAGINGSFDRLSDFYMASAGRDV